MSQLWGIDLGGTKIEGVVLDSQDLLHPLCRLRVDTEAERGYPHILEQIKRLIELLEAQAGPRPKAIGFGTPGVLDPKLQTLKNSNTLCLNGQRLKADLETLLSIEARLSNDANCFALAEVLMGAGAGANTAFGVIMGTGVGGGLVINKKVINGLQGIAGEWGHNVLDPKGPSCYCGKAGCVEKIISGPATENFYRELTGKSLRLKEIVQRHHEKSDEAASKTIENLALWFGRAITFIINILDPEVIILGGGLSNIDELYTLGIEEAKRNVFNNRLETPIIRNKLGDSAGVFGAALL